MSKQIESWHTSILAIVVILLAVLLFSLPAPAQTTVSVTQIPAGQMRGDNPGPALLFIDVDKKVYEAQLEGIEVIKDATTGKVKLRPIATSADKLPFDVFNYRLTNLTSGTITLPYSPLKTSTRLYKNGIRISEGHEFNVETNQLFLTIPPVLSDVFVIDYVHLGK